jgi:hypothetical protein
MIPEKEDIYKKIHMHFDDMDNTPEKEWGYEEGKNYDHFYT